MSPFGIRLSFVVYGQVRGKGLAASSDLMEVT